MSADNNNVAIKRGFQLYPENINREGPPKKEFSITNAFREILSEKNPETKIERYKELIKKALSMAMRGDGDMIKYIINRLEGMPQGSAPQVAVQVNNYQATPEQEALLDEWVVKRYKELEAEGKV